MCRREGCVGTRCYVHEQCLVYEYAASGKQHSLPAGTIIEQTETGLARRFLAILLVTSSKGGMAAAELKRQLGFGSGQTAWAWLHYIRRVMVDAKRAPLAQPVAGAVWARMVEVRKAKPKSKPDSRPIAEQPSEAPTKLQLGRARLAVVPAAGAASLEPVLATYVAPAACMRTDGAKAYQNLADKGFAREPRHVEDDQSRSRLRRSAWRRPSRVRSPPAVAAGHRWAAITAARAADICGAISTSSCSASTDGATTRSAPASPSRSTSAWQPRARPIGPSSAGRRPT